MRALLRLPGTGFDSKLPWTALLPYARAIGEVCRSSLQKKLLYIAVRPVLAPSDTCRCIRRGHCASR